MHLHKPGLQSRSHSVMLDSWKRAGLMAVLLLAGWVPGPALADLQELPPTPAWSSGAANASGGVGGGTELSGSFAGARSGEGEDKDDGGISTPLVSVLNVVLLAKALKQPEQPLLRVQATVRLLSVLPPPQVSNVPLPGAAWLLISGFLGFASVVRRGQRSTNP